MIKKLLNLARKCWHVLNRNEPEIRKVVFWIRNVAVLISLVFNYHLKRLIYA